MLEHSSAAASWDRYMSRQSRQAERLDAIRSVSLEDIVYGRHTRWRRFLKTAGPVLIGVSLFALTAATGSAVYHMLSGPARFPGEGVELASEPPAPPTIGSPPASAATPEVQAAALAALESVAPAALEPRAPQTAESVDVVRLPTPRPDEPIVTGSIAHPVRAAPHTPPSRTIEKHHFRPCRTLQRLAARLPLPRVSCSR